VQPALLKRGVAKMDRTYLGTVNDDRAGHVHDGTSPHGDDNRSDERK
jgi:hypothetical protein